MFKRKVVPVGGHIKIRETCGLLGVSAGTVRRWCNDGFLRSLRTRGGHRRIKFSDVEAVAQLQEKAIDIPSGKCDCAEDILRAAELGEAEDKAVDATGGLLAGLLERRPEDLNRFADTSDSVDTSDTDSADTVDPLGLGEL